MATKERRETPLGKRVYGLRAERGMGQRELSRKARLSHVTLTLIETGRIEAPRMPTLRKLADALGVGVEDLLNPTEPMGKGDAPEAGRPGIGDLPPEAAQAVERSRAAMIVVAKTARMIEDWASGVSDADAAGHLVWPVALDDLEGRFRSLIAEDLYLVAEEGATTEEILSLHLIDAELNRLSALVPAVYEGAIARAVSRRDRDELRRQRGLRHEGDDDREGLPGVAAAGA